MQIESCLCAKYEVTLTHLATNADDISSGFGAVMAPCWAYGTPWTCPVKRAVDMTNNHIACFL